MLYIRKEQETIHLSFVANLGISMDATQVTCAQSIVGGAAVNDMGNKLQLFLHCT